MNAASCKLLVPESGPGDASLFEDKVGTREQWDGVGMDPETHPAGFGHFQGMPRQSEPGNVRDTPDPEFHRCTRTLSV